MPKHEYKDPKDKKSIRIQVLVTEGDYFNISYFAKKYGIGESPLCLMAIRKGMELMLHRDRTLSEREEARIERLERDWRNAEAERRAKELGDDSSETQNINN